MKIEDIAPQLYDSPTVLNHFDAERYVEGLQKFDIQEVGSSKWLDQHKKLEKLNMQAHQSAMSNSDEYVLEALLTYQKVETLIYNLLVIEAWKEFVYPLISKEVAGKNNIRIYFILYNEATLINLFEIILYHKHIVQEIGENIIELIDYVARKLIRLNSGYDFRSITPSSHGLHSDNSQNNNTLNSTQEYMNMLTSKTPLEELQQHYHDIEYRICISTVSIARFLCEHVSQMPLSGISRILDTHDYLMLILPLIENPPWTRRNKYGKWEKLIDYKWLEIPPIDLLKLTKIEGQPWLTLYHIISKQEFGERYVFNNYRKSQLLRVRKYMNEILLDQLPVLADIQRFMDELSIRELNQSSTTTTTTTAASYISSISSMINKEQENLSSSSTTSALSSTQPFLLQQVALMRENIIKNKEWDNIVILQLQCIFNVTDAQDPDIRQLAELYSDEFLEYTTTTTAGTIADTDPPMTS